MSNNGIVLIAYGHKAHAQAHDCIATICKHAPDLPVTVFCNAQLDFGSNVVCDLQFGSTDNEIADLGVTARITKTCLDKLTPYKCTLYMDVDCRLWAYPSLYFAGLADGFEMVMCHSSVQGERWAQHCSPDDREATLELIGYQPMQMQCGVFSFKRSPSVRALFAQWRREYDGTQDQLSFMRALHQKPIKLLIGSQVFNNGSVIQHLFGSLKR